MIFLIRAPGYPKVEFDRKGNRMVIHRGMDRRTLKAAMRRSYGPTIVKRMRGAPAELAAAA